jgi:hypothetical protein
MKSLKLTFAVLGLSLASLMPVMAESSLSVNVPYPFVAGKTKLSAGAYTIQEDTINGILTIRDSEGKAVALLSSPAGQTAGSVGPSLTFVNVRGEMVLMAVHEADRPARALLTRGVVQ